MNELFKVWTLNDSVGPQRQLSPHKDHKALIRKESVLLFSCDIQLREQRARAGSYLTAGSFIFYCESRALKKIAEGNY